MHFHIISIFPRVFESYLDESMIKRGVSKGLIKVSIYDPRDFTDDKHKKVDSRPYSGGPGMVMQAPPILKAYSSIKKKIKNAPHRILMMSPNGKDFTNKTAKNWSKKYKHIVIICGRYEGIDVRVRKALRAQEVSIGPYVLTGGELPAMVIIDAVSRQISGFLGKSGSLEEGRLAGSEIYTRPEELKYNAKSYKVPKVLRSGNHAKIESWKKKTRKSRT